MPVKEIEALAQIEEELRSLSRSAADSCRYNERTAVFGKPLFVYLSELADRIEAAWKREKSQSWHHLEMEELILRHEKEVAELKNQTGNAAAMRDAVVLALSKLDLKEDVPYETVSQKDIDFMKAALSAPPRNCDVGTAEEQTKRYQTFCKCHFCDECPLSNTNDESDESCVVRWAQMPYEAEEGEAK